MSSVIAKLRPLVTRPTSKHTASLFFLHGSGETGAELMAWVGGLIDFSFPHVKVIYPTAPQRPYTALMGAVTTVWFDRKQVSPYSSDMTEDMDSMSETVGQLIDTEVQNGIPRTRIILGGFSMGGAMALYHGLQKGEEFAGVFALSAYLGQKSKVYKHLREQLVGGRVPEVLQCHGRKDQLVLEDWGSDTHTRLKALGVPCSYYCYPDLFHDMHGRELQRVIDFVNKKLPDS